MVLGRVTAPPGIIHVMLAFSGPTQAGDKEEKTSHSSITKWLWDLTSGSSNQSYDIGPHILVDDLNEPKGKFRPKTESLKNSNNVTWSDSDLTPRNDIYENIDIVDRVSKRTRRKFESFKEIKSKSSAAIDNIYENIQDKRKFKRHSFSGTKNRDRPATCRKDFSFQEQDVDSNDDNSYHRIRSGKKKKDRNKPGISEPSVRQIQIKEDDNHERDNYANHASEYELYVNQPAALTLDSTLDEHDYEVIRVPRDSATVENHRKQFKGNSDRKRYEKNPGGGSSGKTLSRHCVLYHSQRGSRSTRRRQQATLRRHSFNVETETVAMTKTSEQFQLRAKLWIKLTRESSSNDDVTNRNQN
ncbi:hypothetical protein WDU94_000897 [Cyamophila willieti]